MWHLLVAEPPAADAEGVGNRMSNPIQETLL